MSYSQFNEEEIILNFFGEDKGRFMDIGAYEGKTFSNVRALLDRGWEGVMVEPEPKSFIGLMENTKEFKDRVILVNAAVAPQEDLREFWDSNGDAVSSLDRSHVKKWGQHIPMREYRVMTVSPSRLFGTFGGFQFINLDVEGINWELFQLMPLDMPELKMICVEYDNRKGAMIDLADKFGFSKVFENSVNLIFTR